MSNDNRIKKNITKITVIVAVCIIALVSTVMASNNNKADKIPVTSDKNIANVESSAANTNTTGALPAKTSGTVPEYIGEAKAKTIVLAKVPKATIAKINLEQDNGRAEYDGEAYLSNVKYDFKIDALTGAILEWKTETKSTTQNTAKQNTAKDATSTSITADAKSSPNTAKVNTSSYVGETVARSIALKKVPGATITEIYLENDDGRVEYDGEMYLNNVKYEFTIDAVNGKILEWESDNNDDTSSDDVDNGSDDSEDDD
jgi:uncharacterized membrane protein YkoI